MITARAKKVMVVAVVCGVASVVSFAGAFMYVIGQGKTLREQAQAVADHAVQQKTYEALAALVASTKTDREEMQHYVLTEDETITFLADTEAMATAQGVTISTDALTVVNGKDFNTLKVNFTLEGDARSVHAVIQVLETLPYMSYINRLSLEGGAAGAAEAAVELMVMLAKS